MDKNTEISERLREAMDLFDKNLKKAQITVAEGLFHLEEAKKANNECIEKFEKMLEENENAKRS